MIVLYLPNVSLRVWWFISLFCIYLCWGVSIIRGWDGWDGFYGEVWICTVHTI